MVNIRLKILDKGRIVEEQLIRVLQKHENAIIEGSSEDTTLSTKVSALETAIGKASGEGAGGILKDVKDVKDAIGKASGEGAGGIAKDVADVKSAIGDASTEGTILARLKALEDAQTPADP